ncbi:putative sodium-coupled neutral amino acid transporter 7 [Nymphon striatum]|nr:putative sodium-coupled neutral amino acid transporter 7 [Nymphon striatum]
MLILTGFEPVPPSLQVSLSTDHFGTLRGLTTSRDFAPLYGSPVINQTGEPNERTNIFHNSERSEFITSHGGAVSGISWYGAAFLLINTALGAGILNYPQAYDRAGGIISGTIIQLFLLILLTSTMIILAYCSDINGDLTYHDVLLSVVGRRAQQIAAVSILLTCFGICVTFLIVIGDQFDRLFLSIFGDTFCKSWYLHRKFTITVTATLFILPICFPRRIDFLKYFSSLGVLTMLYTVFLIIYEYFSANHVAGDIKTKPKDAMDLFFILPIFCFAYQTHEVVVSVYACMKRRNIRTFAITVSFSMLTLFVIYSATGICGYLTFGSKVDPDVMKSYGADSPLVLVAMVVLTIKMITTYPPLLLCGRGALDGLYCEFRGISVENIIRNEKRRRIIITITWFFLALTLAIFVPNIGIVLEMLGSLASANVFIFPGLCLVKTMSRETFWYKSYKKYCGYLYGLFLILFGSFIFVVVIIHLCMQGDPSESGDVIC